MGRAEAGIGEARADSDDGDGRLVIADVGADLLEAARRDEGRDGVGDRAQAVHGHAGGNPHHVGFRHAAVEEARLGAWP